jgi:hypothetical protein
LANSSRSEPNLVHHYWTCRWWSLWAFLFGLLSACCCPRLRSLAWLGSYCWIYCLVGFQRECRYHLPLKTVVVANCVVLCTWPVFFLKVFRTFAKCFLLNYLRSLVWSVNNWCS